VLDLLLCHVASHYFREIGGRVVCVCACPWERASLNTIYNFNPLKEIESLATIVTF
jgi:hypothetical protein